LELFPKDKNAPFIIYGQNPTDVAALRALAIVHRYGWKKVYWFWGGMDAWANRPIIPPATDPRVQLMTAEKLQKALPIGAHIVDVRTAADFKRGRIPNARHIDIQWRPPTPGQTSSTFHMKMDELPSQRNALLVFYGEDDLAWEPYQAALWAKANGWQNVFWLRGGFSQWRAAGEIFRNRYRSVRSKK
jgi:3-mercaptopyruvate sulfurtransferase SseA